jgi:Mlc titration factor MtfA (ptsG expression regulator)
VAVFRSDRARALLTTAVLSSWTAIAMELEIFAADFELAAHEFAVKLELLQRVAGDGVVA